MYNGEKVRINFSLLLYFNAGVNRYHFPVKTATI